MHVITTKNFERLSTLKATAHRLVVENFPDTILTVYFIRIIHIFSIIRFIIRKERQLQSFAINLLRTVGISDLFTYFDHTISLKRFLIVSSYRLHIMIKEIAM